MNDSPQPASALDSPRTTQSVDLNIKQLVLRGFSPPHRHRIAQAIQSELTRLVTEQGVPASLTTSLSIDRLDTGDLQVSAHARAETVGVRVARLVYRGMGR